MSLEEAAVKLGLTPEQFKVNLKTHKDFRAVRPLMGGSTMHFRSQDIDELARKLGMGSDPEFPGSASSDAAIPLAIDDDQVEIGREPPRTAGSSGTKLGGGSSKRLKAPVPSDEAPLEIESDEFVPLTAEKAKASDSDIRLGKKSGDYGTPTEEIDLSKESKKTGKAEVFKIADEGSKSKGKKPPADESDSDFELTLADGSDEVDLGSMPRDVTGKSGKSGVKLKSPSDSGISLEKEAEDSSSEFELNLDSRSSKKFTGPKSTKAAKPDSDSEFELSLDDSSSQLAPPLEKAGEQKDIFETDFDIPALDDESASEAVVLEETDTDLESSDFDLALEEASASDDSASAVVELEEDVDGVEAVDDLDGPSAAEDLAGVEDEEDERRPVFAGPPQPAKWGVLPALVLFPCVFLLFIVSLMGYELVKGAWGYRQPNKATSPITNTVAGLFFEDLPKEGGDK
jgi:hypothetical protein